MIKSHFFVYRSHTCDIETEITTIRMYGLTEDNKNVCLRISNFTPYVYLELPTEFNWDINKAQILGNKIDQMLDNKKPLKKALIFKHRLYGAYLIQSGKRKEFPYLFCSFSHYEDIKILEKKLRFPLNILGFGTIRLKMHEQDADPILQLVSARNVPTSGWIQFLGKLVKKDDQVTLCDYEYIVNYRDIEPYQSDTLPQPKIMGYDIEVNSTNPATMPDEKRPGDKIFQISCVFCRSGDSPDKYKSYLISLGDPEQKVVGENVILIKCNTESDLLEEFVKLIRLENPNIIAGYNILGFDIKYMIARAKEPTMCYNIFDVQGFHKFAHSKEIPIDWSSRAYKNQKFLFLDAEGRLFVDLLPLVRRDFKFNSYTLKFISNFFLGQTKDPLTHHGIFKCYRLGVIKNAKGEYSNKAKKAMGIVGKYCVQDSVLVIKLMEHLKTWIGLSEMAKICNVQIFDLYTQGQQKKVYAQLYKLCMYENIVVEKDAYKYAEDERYTGAYIFPPVPGCYDNVIPLDFASLYPSIIIAYNIDYSTWRKDDCKISDIKCNTMKWADHVWCEHDPKVIRVLELTKYIDKEDEKIKDLRKQRDKTLDKYRKMEIKDEIKKLIDLLKPYKKERSEIKKGKAKNPMCANRNYSFVKEPKGIMPICLEKLLGARADVRERQKVIFDEIEKLKKEDKVKHADKIKELQELYDILEKRQLAYKVSANSMYGIMGTKRGLMPFMPGAMCVTYMGRININIVAKTLQEKYGAMLVYGDTDSNYINFPALKSSAETWDYAIKVAGEISELFPKPMKLEFEKVIYIFFLILTKKRYMYRSCNRDGVVKKELGFKGVLLARRDNSKFVGDLYYCIVDMIEKKCTKDEILYYLLSEIYLMCSHSKPREDFIITKAIGDVGDFNPIPFVNEKGKLKAKIGNYTTPILDNDPIKREKQMEKKGASSPEEFYLLCLPAQVQLAEKIRGRGLRVDVGTRLEYVIADPENHNSKQYEKIESVDYIKEHGNIVKIDYLYYLKALSTPVDQVLSVVFKDNDCKDFILNQYKYRSQIREKVIKCLKAMFRPKLVFKE